MQRLVLIVVVFVILSFVAVKWLAPHIIDPNATRSNYSGEVLIGGPFMLTDHRGHPFTERNLTGKFSLVYFGFTYCPDICPTTLLIIAGALKDLGNEADQVQPLLISVDFKRDTVEVLSNYVKNFHPKLIGLTGTDEQIKQVANAYKVYYQIVEDSSSALGYQVDHSGFVYLMGPDGKYITHFPHNVSQSTLAEGIRNAIKND